MAFFGSAENDLRKYFDQLRTSKAKGFSHLAKSVDFAADRELSTEVEEGLASYLGIQNTVRPVFGKPSFNAPSIGDFPHFDHLKGTTLVERCAITTMFMDIENSTRLNLFFTPEEVFEIKNAFITSAMAIVRAFDGHVHRIMGDAVMAFFGNPSQNPVQGIVDGINCAAYIQHFVQSSVLPALNGFRQNSQFGVRVGLDFAPEDSVIWSSYGYPGMEEVTATGLNVDLASKLQHKAPKNGVMLGQSLLDFIDFPDRLTFARTRTREGLSQEVPFLEPNHTRPDGTALNYRMRLLDWAKYLNLIEPSLTNLDGKAASPDEYSTLNVIANEHFAKGGNVIAPLKSIARPIHKNRWLKYEIRIGFQPSFPYRVTYSVENHGQEAAEFPSNANHEEKYRVETIGQHTYRVPHWESTKYKGLHLMRVKVENERISLWKDFGLYVC